MPRNVPQKLGVPESTLTAIIPFALQISAVPKEAPGCSAKALPAWSWHRAYRDVFTASFDGHPGAKF
ncbi:hypothetical protein EQU24_14650 [Methylotuvimicrobium buryatense]|uniref:Uncharacterized protein n=1 Tax=Methylotuvimicrobium buryatense TaxID=95641 RepID=A0A4P9US14_METBY|nr:hypothetical protein EQU24_14650 [Methylotuvimicrobium buryatense]